MTLEEINRPVDLDATTFDCVFREGFVFTNLNRPNTVYNALVIRNPSHARPWGSATPISERSFEEHVALVNALGLEKACVIADDFVFLRDCPSLRHLLLRLPSHCEDGFDYSFVSRLEGIKSLQCVTEYGKFDEKHTSVSYSGLQGLEYLKLFGDGHMGFEALDSVKSLRLHYSKRTKPENIFCSRELDSLALIVTNVTDLDGIERSERMQCLELSYNRRLSDISALQKVSSTLKGLRIEKCAKIKDFSVLRELHQLEYLHLEGSNVLPDLRFLESMPHLKCLSLRMKVEDGDLERCLSVPFVHCGRIYKHYNMEAHELPKDYSKITRGADGIDEWRRIF